MKRTLLLVSALLAGCAAYRPLALPTDDALLHDVAQLRVDAGRMPDAALASSRCNAAWRGSRNWSTSC